MARDAAGHSPGYGTAADHAARSPLSKPLEIRLIRTVETRRSARSRWKVEQESHVGRVCFPNQCGLCVVAVGDVDPAREAIRE
jgi:hypothetical protein